jgi:hypothetical protein
MKIIKSAIILISLILILNSCKSLPGGDAKENPPDPKLRVKKNLEEGKGFRLSTFGIDGKSRGTGGNFEFASSNELWKASLDVIDFMPLASVNYSGGMIITDWYAKESTSNEVVKISIRFLTNEIRSDALDIKVFTKKCNLKNECAISEKSENLVTELKKEILRKAALYKKSKKEKKRKNSKPYVSSTPGKD